MAARSAPMVNRRVPANGGLTRFRRTAADMRSRFGGAGAPPFFEIFRMHSLCSVLLATPWPQETPLREGTHSGDASYRFASSKISRSTRLRATSSLTLCGQCGDVASSDRSSAGVTNS